MYDVHSVSSLEKSRYPALRHLVSVRGPILMWYIHSTPSSNVHRLKTWKQPEGQIRLSSDEGPPSHEFLEDDYDEDNEDLDMEDDEDDEPLTERGTKATAGSQDRSDQAAVQPLRTMSG